MTNQTERFDAIIIGAGHNGLVAACYLARAGLDAACAVDQPGPVSWRLAMAAPLRWLAALQRRKDRTRRRNQRGGAAQAPAQGAR